MGKLKIGVFGLWRGMEYVRQFHAHPDTEIWAVCDSDEKARCGSGWALRQSDQDV